MRIEEAAIEAAGEAAEAADAPRADRRSQISYLGHEHPDETEAIGVFLGAILERSAIGSR